MAFAIFLDILYLLGTIAKAFKGLVNRLVDNLEIAAAGKLFKLDNCELGLDTCCIAVHDQSDGTCWCDNTDLGVSVTMFFPHIERLVPDLSGSFEQIGRTVFRIYPAGPDRKSFIIVFRHVVRRPAMIFYHPQHFSGVLLITGERPQIFCQLRRCLVRFTCYQSGYRSGNRQRLR